MSNEDKIASLLEEIKELLDFLTNDKPTPDDEIEAQEVLLTKYKKLKELNAYPEQKELIKGIIRELEAWDTLEHWFFETDIPEDIKNFLETIGAQPSGDKESSLPLEKSPSKEVSAPDEEKEGGESDQKPPAFNIAEIISEVTKQFKGEIGNLEKKIESLQKELTEKDKTLEGVKKEIQDIEPEAQEEVPDLEVEAQEGVSEVEPEAQEEVPDLEVEAQEGVSEVEPEAQEKIPEEKPKLETKSRLPPLKIEIPPADQYKEQKHEEEKKEEEQEIFDEENLLKKVQKQRKELLEETETKKHISEDDLSSIPTEEDDTDEFEDTDIPEFDYEGFNELVEAVSSSPQKEVEEPTIQNDSSGSETIPDEGEEPPTPVESEPIPEVEEPTIQNDSSGSETKPEVEEPPTPIESEPVPEVEEPTIQNDSSGSETKPEVEEPPTPVESEPVTEIEEPPSPPVPSVPPAPAVSEPVTEIEEPPSPPVPSAPPAPAESEPVPEINPPPTNPPAPPNVPAFEVSATESPPPSQNISGITEIKVEEYEQKRKKSSAQDLYNVFSAMLDDKPSKTESAGKKSKSKSSIKSLIPKSKQEKSKKIFQEPKEETEQPKKEEAGIEVFQQELGPLPDDKDTLYQELIAMEGKRYALEKSMNKLEERYQKGTIDEFEFKGEIQKIKTSLENISKYITDIRRKIATM